MGPSIDEIDVKLQKLLLDIENKSKTTASLSGGAILEKTGALTQADLTNQELQLKGELESEAVRITAVGSVAASLSENQVIDLTSPSPINARWVSKLQGSNVDCIHIIESSDSENEISPDHARKAEELRLFIAGVKDY